MRPLALGLATAALLFGGCTVHDSPKPPADTAHWRIGFTVTPKQPRQLDPAQFRVQVTDSKSKPVPGAVVTVQIAMPTMDMGRNEAALHEAPPGTYTGVGRFTMPGDWEATVAAAADKGASHQSQTFPVSVQ